jgi:hypothetical protein
VCACPTLAIASPIMPLVEQIMVAPSPPNAFLGIGVVTDPQSRLHAVVVAFEPGVTPLDTDIDLSTTALGDVPFVGLGWDADIGTMMTRAGYTSTSGTLRLTRACSAGVAGTMTDVLLLENTEPMDPTPAPGGCTFMIPALDFDYGAPCP